MHTFRILATTLLSALAINAYSQNMPHIPKIRDFDVSYESDVHQFWTNSSGPIYWKAHTYMTDEKPPREITELRGHLDINIKFLIIGVKHTYTEFITKIDRKNQTIESISCTQGDDTSHLSDYTRELAIRENIDTNKAKSIDHRLMDFKNGRVYNLELMADSMTNCLSQADTVLPFGSIGFQEAYFTIPKTSGSDTAIIVHYRGKNYILPIETRKEKGYLTAFVDLTKPNPMNPSERLSIIDELHWLRITFGEDDIPNKVLGQVPGPLGDVEIELKRIRK